MPAKGSMNASAMRRASVFGRCLDGVGADGVQALSCLLDGEAVCRGVKQYEGVLGTMGGGEYGVLG